MHFDVQAKAIVGDHGTLVVVEGDEVSRKLAMLIEGECEGVGPIKAANKYGLTKQRYFQLRDAYQKRWSDCPDNSNGQINRPQKMTALGGGFPTRTLSIGAAGSQFPIVHVSAQPPSHPGRSDFPSPVGGSS